MSSCGEHPRLEVDVEIEAGVQLVTADPGQVVALRIEEQLVEQAARGVDATAARPDAAF